MLENLEPRSDTPPSKVLQIRETLEPDDQKLFDVYLRDCAGWSPNDLSAALRRQGILISGDTIRRFRARNSLC